MTKVNHCPLSEKSPKRRKFAQYGHPGWQTKQISAPAWISVQMQISDFGVIQHFSL
jgi:hypothetical protein